jgi:mannose-6-phosphate isomerase-like protein (cupin superfamily)
MSKATLIKSEEAKVIDLGTKVIRKYTSPDSVLEVNHMIMTGRQPEKEATFNLESKCHFMIYVLKGNGKFIVEANEFEVSVGDVIDFPANTRFASIGDFEYLAFESPAFTLDQAKIVDENGVVVEVVEK